MVQEVPTTNNNIRSGFIIFLIYKLSMQAFNTYSIPTQIGKPIGGMHLDIGSGDYAAFYDEKIFAIVELGEKGAISKIAKYQIGGIVSMVSIIKGYVLLITTQQKLCILDVRVEMVQQQTKFTLNYFIQHRTFSSYFLRQVSVNMIELQIFNSIQNTKHLTVIQFTIKQKTGIMEFQLDKTFKILKQNKKQLYASKAFFDPYLFMVIKLKNFSDNCFVAKKSDLLLSHVFGVCKKEEYYGLSKQFTLMNLQNPGTHKKLPQLKQFSLKNSIAHINYLLLQNEDSVVLFLVEERKITKIGTQSKGYHWQISTNGKMLGISHDRTKFKIVDKSIPPCLAVSPQIIDKSTELAECTAQKVQEKKEQESQNPFKPKKIVQKTKISISKNNQPQYTQEKAQQPQTKQNFQFKNTSLPNLFGPLPPLPQVPKMGLPSNLFGQKSDPYLQTFYQSQQNFQQTSFNKDNKDKEPSLQKEEELSEDEFEQGLKSLLKANNQLKQEIMSKIEMIPQQLNKSKESWKANNDLLDYEQATKQLEQKAEQNIKEFMNKKWTEKVNGYFKNAMSESKMIYDKTLEYYTNKSKENIHSLQIQFQQQEKLTDQIKIASGDLQAVVEYSIQEGHQTNALLLKEWERSFDTIDKKLLASQQKLKNMESLKQSNPKQQILQSLVEMREKLEKVDEDKKKKRKSVSFKYR